MARFIPFNFQGKLHFFLPRRKSPPFFLLFEQFIKRNSHLIGQYNSTRIQKIVISLILKMFVYIQDKNFFQGNSSWPLFKTQEHIFSCFFPFCQFRMKCSSSSLFNNNRHAVSGEHLFPWAVIKAETKLFSSVDSSCKMQMSTFANISPSYYSESDEVWPIMNVRSMLLDGISLFPLFLTSGLIIAAYNVANDH